jgi:NTE family protein
MGREASTFQLERIMANTYHFRNLVFEGGGVKGIAYVGALAELKQRNILSRIKRVGGTSAGAINAVLLATRHSPEETRELLWKLNFNNFMDDSWGVVRDSKRLLDKYGWYKGEFFRSWIGQIIENKTGNRNATFNDLKNQGMPELYLVGTNISTGFSEVFSAEHTPRVSVADAARISMSIPLFFAAVRNFRDDVYVDGGVLRNYPVKLFDRKKYVTRGKLTKHSRSPKYYDAANKEKPASSSDYVYNKETLGFKLDSDAEIAMFRDGAEPPSSHVDDFFDYGLALVKTILNAQDNAHLHSDDWQRTIYIDSKGVGTTEFNLSDEKKKTLVDSGVNGVSEYFKWYDKAPKADLPSNHPEFVDAD